MHCSAARSDSFRINASHTNDAQAAVAMGREWIFPSPGGISPIDRSHASSDFNASENDIDTARIGCYRRTSGTAIGYADEQQRRRWKIRTRCPQSREQGTGRCRRHPHATTQTRGIARDCIGCAISSRGFSRCGATTSHRTTCTTCTCTCTTRARAVIER